MKELSIIEIEAVSGAGWLQNALANIGGVFGNTLYNSTPIQFTASMTIQQAIPTLGQVFGSSIGHNLGGQLENMLTNLPVVGGLFEKVLSMDIKI
ncbi:hypothetical protein [Entomohabitans teleogrylli]|uniref:hypothetical protein n=1 Tax=Entomohabitans teleogrylli TaxID=1384589 RepID=UPI00073D55EE|nr:hypothetical protein [Entomohabitans teleogrylli]